MRFSEDTDKGIMAKDTGDRILRFGRCIYDGKLRHYTPKSCLTFRNYVTYNTKSEATKEAKKLGFTSGHVQKIGNRFCSAWGIKHDPRDDYFLANFE